MTHNEMLRRVVEARMNRMSTDQKLDVLRAYMMADYGGLDMEELQEFYEDASPNSLERFSDILKMNTSK